MLPLIFSFLILANLVTPHIHRNIFVSATFVLFSCALFTAYVSAPYTIVGLTIVLTRVNLSLYFDFHSAVTQHLVLYNVMVIAAFYAAVGSTVLFLGTYLPYEFLPYDSMNLVSKLAACLLSNIAMPYGWYMMSMRHRQGTNR